MLSRFCLLTVNREELTGPCKLFVDCLSDLHAVGPSRQIRTWSGLEGCRFVPVACRHGEEEPVPRVPAHHRRSSCNCLRLSFLYRVGYDQPPISRACHKSTHTTRNGTISENKMWLFSSLISIVMKKDLVTKISFDNYAKPSLVIKCSCH